MITPEPACTCDVAPATSCPVHGPKTSSGNTWVARSSPRERCALGDGLLVGFMLGMTTASGIVMLLTAFLAKVH